MLPRSDTVLRTYSPSVHSLLTTDASPMSINAVLEQVDQYSMFHANGLMQNRVIHIFSEKHCLCFGPSKYLNDIHLERKSPLLLIMRL